MHSLYYAFCELLTLGTRTNLPKEVMGYPDFTYSPYIQNSYISSEEVLKFLNAYADHFQLRSHIHLQHEVIRIKPNGNRQQQHPRHWEVFVITFYSYSYTLVFHYNVPSMSLGLCVRSIHVSVESGIFRLYIRVQWSLHETSVSNDTGNGCIPRYSDPQSFLSFTGPL